MIVAIGFFARGKVSYLVFYFAALTQVLFYTVFRECIVDVPEVFALSAEQMSYLTALVVFHCVTLVLVTIALRVI